MLDSAPVRRSTERRQWRWCFLSFSLISPVAKNLQNIHFLPCFSDRFDLIVESHRLSLNRTDFSRRGSGQATNTKSLPFAVATASGRRSIPTSSESRFAAALEVFVKRSLRASLEGEEYTVLQSTSTVY
jgi:hypothetical protein